MIAATAAAAAHADQELTWFGQELFELAEADLFSQSDHDTALTNERAEGGPLGIDAALACGEPRCADHADGFARLDDGPRARRPLRLRHLVGGGEARIVPQFLPALSDEQAVVTRTKHNASVPKQRPLVMRI
jgi:hypothetical protein